MTNEKLYEAIGDISDKYIEEAKQVKSEKRPAIWLKWGAMAAGLCLVALGIFIVLGLRGTPDGNEQSSENQFVENRDSEGQGLENQSSESVDMQANQSSEELPDEDLSGEESISGLVEKNDEPDEGAYEEGPAVGGSDYSFLRKYIDEVYNIQLASDVVGREACAEWVDNVFLKKTPEEQEAIPPIYQIIVDLKISKEDLIQKNNELGGIYLSDETIEALYQEDIEMVKKLLMSPLALYYDGEIYTFDEMSADVDVVAGIPSETLNEYLDYIETVCEQEGLIKYMQEEIDNIRKTCINSQAAE